jgi:hypothetical protein
VDQSLVNKAHAALVEFFEDTSKRTTADIAVARIAWGLLSTNAREKQAAGAADALTFMIARELSKDKGELQDFLTAAMPSAPVVRALPPRTES